MKLTISTLLFTLLTVAARPLALQAEQHSSISGTPCSLVNCKSACFRSPEACHALCQGDKDLPLCAIGTTPPHASRVPFLPGIHRNHTISNLLKDAAKVHIPIRDDSTSNPPPSKLSIPTPYCSEFECNNICDPCWIGWPEEAPMADLCVRWCNDNVYMPMCPEGVTPVYEDI
ncbi:hypothetical protein BKA58DRAFT_393508 [Alternaria rosae]|uniref:uncharacterized protein n=1 Tax=Alternaria rosae TaxID=1187941 RepID=UPI001E8E9E5B|nr:uncharacterized protein BKA58DRAFT_393508 [Alternaria rosae]KAH6859067.1 hypothetical protein BKA58DRAFT_393508 [Alternaria rosae]